MVYVFGRLRWLLRFLPLAGWLIRGMPEKSVERTFRHVGVGLRSNPCHPGRMAVAVSAASRAGYHAACRRPGGVDFAPSRGWVWSHGEGTRPMVIVGVDAHKATHTCVAIGSTGRIVGEKTVPATTDGHNTALRWARRFVWGGADVGRGGRSHRLAPP